jgi:X-X-X-Leu-X-X-Gly heptad repeat protein
MTGSDWSFLGVAVSVIGTLIAAYGSRLSGQEAKNRSDQLVSMSEKVVTSTEQVAAKSSELASKSDQLAAKSDELAAKSDEISKLNREIAELNQRYGAYVMGIGSYFYLHVRGFGQASPQALIKHVGSNPVRDTEILIFDITDQISDLAARRTQTYDTNRAHKQKQFVQSSYAGPQNMLDARVFESNPTRNTYAYFIYLSGANGTYRQIIQLVKASDVWKQGYVVQKLVAPNKFEPIGQFFDDGFPTEGELIVRPSPDYPRLH